MIRRGSALALLLGATLAFAGGAPRVPDAWSTRAVAERLSLPDAVRVELAPLMHEVRLKADAAVLQRVAAELSHQKSMVCPHHVLEANTLRLRCGRENVDAKLTRAAGKVYLDLSALRGLPWKGDDVIPGAPFLLGAKSVDLLCKGARPVEKAECAFATGRLADAKLLFEKDVLDTPDAPLASLRLGDIALAEDRPAAAADHYAKAGILGFAGGLAAERLCDLTSACEPDRTASSTIPTTRYPEPVRTELELRLIRRATYRDEAGKGAEKLAARLGEAGRPGACAGEAFRACRALTLHALRDEPDTDRASALAAFMALPGEAWRRTDWELVSAGADASASLGAPVYGAFLRAAVTPNVPPPELGPHLLHTAELYLAGGERGRAGVIVDYAVTRLTRAERSGRRWAQVVRSVRPSVTVDREAVATKKRAKTYAIAEADQTKASALIAISRSRQLSAELE